MIDWQKFTREAGENLAAAVSALEQRWRGRVRVVSTMTLITLQGKSCGGRGVVMCIAEFSVREPGALHYRAFDRDDYLLFQSLMRE